MLEGRSRVEVASRLVQYPASSSPSIGGMTGTEPVDTTRLRPSSVRGFSPFRRTSTWPGATILASPRTNSAPAASRLPTWPPSSG
jgi:hypothetical protein